MSNKKKLSKNALLKRAKAYPIKNAKKLKKKALIRELQVHEGYTDCFARIEGCQVEACFYRALCQK